MRRTTFEEELRKIDHDTLSKTLRSQKIKPARRGFFLDKDAILGLCSKGTLMGVRDRIRTAASYLALPAPC